MIMAMRLTRGLIGCVLIVLALTASISAAPETGAADPAITVRYSGTIDATREPMGEHPRGPDLHEVHFRWSLVWKGRMSQLEQVASQRFETQSLTGTVTYVDRVQLPAETNRNDCTGIFSARPGAKIPVVISLNPDGRKGFGVQLTRPISDTYLVSSNTKSNYDLCTRVFAGALPSKSQVVSPLFYFPTNGGARPNTIRHFEKLPPNDVYRTTVQESVSVTVAGKRPPQGAAGADAKRAARDDLRQAIERAKGPCLHLAISLGVITTGAVWTSVGAPIPGGIPAGGSLIATGAVMGSAVAPLCHEQIKQIVVSYSIYKRDPPVPKLAGALRLPSCTRWQGKVREYCTELSAAVEKLVAAENRVLPVLKRLQSAAARLVAARTAGNAAGVTKAQADVDTAVASLEAARAASSSAGKELARIVKAAGVQGVLTKADSVETIDALLAALARVGVPALDLRKIAPSALRPGRIDVLAALAA